MMEDRPGWIKLYRKLLDNDLWGWDVPYSPRDAFIYVLLAANWKDSVARIQGKDLTVKRGQLFTSIRKMSTRFQWDKRRVYSWLRFLNSAGIVTYETMESGTLLTVVNYEKYQGERDTIAHTLAPTDAPRLKKNKEETELEASSSIFASPAPEARSADPPSGATAEVPTEMYDDDDDDDDDGIVVHSLEEFHAVWDAIHSQKTTPSTSPESLENNRK